MGKILAVTHVTLDGIMQSPARPDEDTRGGFRDGGWSVPYGDAVMASEIGPGAASDRSGNGGLLLGRRTCMDLYRVLPQRVESPFTKRLNTSRKFVASNTLTEPLPWQNSTLLNGDIIPKVSDLKETLSGDLVVIGSGVLLEVLLQHDLVDELLLSIHPLVLGGGRRLFPTEGRRMPLKLTQTTLTTTGVIIARYERAESHWNQAKQLDHRWTPGLWTRRGGRLSQAPDGR
jgi:dihydrofolate reductase